MEVVIRSSKAEVYFAIHRGEVDTELFVKYLVSIKLTICPLLCYTMLPSDCFLLSTFNHDEISAFLL